VACMLCCPACLQVWGVPSSNASKVLPGGLPKLLALLWHEGRLAWDIKWCPDPSPYISTSSNSTGSSSSQVPLQGLLAACLANGDVVVWAVPTIQHLLDCAEQHQQHQQQVQEQEQQQEQVLSLQLPYVWQMASAAVGGSLCSCCSWLPSYPHNKLLVGCWDGNVVVWQLSVGAQGEGAALGAWRAETLHVATPWQSLWVQLHSVGSDAGSGWLIVRTCMSLRGVSVPVQLPTVLLLFAVVCCRAPQAVPLLLRCRCWQLTPHQSVL
jgi:hypothetical protein